MLHIPPAWSLVGKINWELGDDRTVPESFSKLNFPLHYVQYLSHGLTVTFTFWVRVSDFLI